MSCLQSCCVLGHHPQVAEVPVPEAMKADMETRRSELVERLSEVSVNCVCTPLYTPPPVTHPHI